MIKKLAPRPWQAEVVSHLEFAANLGREDCRTCCWHLRFPLSAMHDAGYTAQQAAAWAKQHAEEGPRVLSRRWGDSKHAVYIGRGSIWGNPFVLGRHGDRAAVIAQHEAWLRGQHELLRALPALRGRDLVCFCSPFACHGDLLLKLANGTRDDLIAWWRAAA